MIDSKVAAMRRIAIETEAYGGSPFPIFMRSNMEQWQREGLVALKADPIHGVIATLTDKGRALAKKAMRP